MIDNDDILTRLRDLGDHLDNSRQHHPSREPGHVHRSTDRKPHRRRHGDRRLRRLPVVAAALVLVGVLAVGLVAIRHRNSAHVDQVPLTSTPIFAPSRTYRGADLATSLPLVGNAWANSMDFSLDRHTNARIYDVWQASIAACMRQHGFDYQAVPYPDNGSYEDQVNPLDRAYATVMGYHPLPAAPIDPNPHTDEIAAAAGDCSNTVQPATSGQLGNYFDDNDQLRTQLSRAINGFATTSTGIAVAAAWADCMTHAGYHYVSPQDPIRIYEEAATITTSEITTRLADLECDTTVGYTHARHDWEAARVATWRDSARIAIQVAITERADLQQRLAQLEINLFGSSRQ